MSVTVDHEKLDIVTPNLRTLGDVFRRLQASNRLIVRLVIDGVSPDPTHLSTIHGTPLAGHTVFIETVDPKSAALEVLVQAYAELDSADLLKAEAAKFLQSNNWNEAMERLHQCLAKWQQAQKAIVTVGKMFKIDVEGLTVTGRPLRAFSQEFTRQLRDLQTAIQSADMVGVSDVLVYETAHTGDSWRAAIESLRTVIGSPETVQSGA